MVNLRQHFTFNEYCYLREELERSLARRRQAEHCSQLALSQQARTTSASNQLR